MRRILPIPLLLLLTACTVEVHPLELPVREPEPLPAEVAGRFDYAHVGSATLTPVWDDDEVEVQRGSLFLRIPGDETTEEAADPPQPLEVEFEYWRSKSAPAGPGPVVLVTPILGGGKSLARTNCRDFARAGLHVVLAWRGTKVLRRSWTLEQVEGYLRRAVASRMALLDWVSERPEVDPQRMAAFGISMGGILTSIFAAAEPRLHSAVIALAGGDVPGIVRSSTEGRLVRFRETKQAELGLGEAELEARFRAVFPSDPLNLARHVDPRRILLIHSKFDTVVRPEFQERLWDALGRPLRYDIPTAHYTGALMLPYVTGIISRWYQGRLGAPAGVGKDQGMENQPGPR